MIRPTSVPRIRSWILLAAVAVLAVRANSDPARNAAPPPSPKYDPPPSALFADNFAKDDLKGWRSDKKEAWSVKRGQLRADLPDGKQQHSFLYAGDSTWVDYAVDLDVCGMRGVDKGVIVRVQGERGLGVDLRGPGYQDLILHLNELPLGSGRIANGNAVWHHVRIEIRGNDCRVTIDKEVVFDKRLRFKVPPSGGIALAAYTGGIGQCTVYYDNVVVTPLASEAAR